MALRHATIQLRRLSAMLGEALRCATCGKKTTVANTAGHRRPFAAEPVSAATHCACPGGPAHDGPPVCATCGDRGEIDDPHHPGRDVDPFTPPTMPCPDCPAVVVRGASFSIRCVSCNEPMAHYPCYDVCLQDGCEAFNVLVNDTTDDDGNAPEEDAGSYWTDVEGVNRRGAC